MISGLGRSTTLDYFSFHERTRREDGAYCIDGALLAISSGARSFGYPALSEGSPVVPMGHPRRRVQPAGIPVLELLSEYESEGNASTWRPDADQPSDRYRLYQVAGSSHTAGPPAPPSIVAAEQLARVGVRRLRQETLEPATDARLDFVARAMAELLEQWASGVTPPCAPPLRRLDDPAAGPKGLSEGALPLERDAVGNAVGGVRTLWVDVPVASYYPHSTPRPGAYEVSPFAPVADAASAADLVGHRRPFTVAQLTARYGGPAGYVEAAGQRLGELVRDRWLLRAEAEELLAGCRAMRW